MKKVVIRPYKLGSKGARLLASSLSQKLGYFVRRVSTTYIPRRNEVVINWGNGSDYWRYEHDPNHTTKAATNKLEAFKAFSEKGVSCPEFTTSKEVANGWLGEGCTVVCRTILSGNSGRGIIIVDGNNALPNAPLYVKYKKKKKEFRAHVVDGAVVEVVEKRKKKGYENVDTKIRNHTNGWVFCRDNVIVPGDLNDVAIAAVRAVGLCFGAVDLIWNEKEDKTYALEVNSAPGIEDTTVESYSNAFVEMFK